MYKIKDNVIYKGAECFIGKVLGGGRYMIITCDKYNVFDVYEKDLDPPLAPGDYVTLVNKGCKFGPDGFNINSMVIDNVMKNGCVTIKGVRGSYNTELFKRIPIPRHTIQYSVYDNVSGKVLETFNSEKEAIEKCETLNEVSINIGDIFKHYTGITVEVINSTLEETEVMLEIAGSVYYSKYDNQQFLKEFAK